MNPSQNSAWMWHFSRLKIWHTSRAPPHPAAGSTIPHLHLARVYLGLLHAIFLDSPFYTAPALWLPLLISKLIMQLSVWRSLRSSPMWSPSEIILGCVQCTRRNLNKACQYLIWNRSGNCFTFLVSRIDLIIHAACIMLLFIVWSCFVSTVLAAQQYPGPCKEYKTWQWSSLWVIGTPRQRVQLMPQKLQMLLARSLLLQRTGLRTTSHLLHSNLMIIDCIYYLSFQCSLTPIMCFVRTANPRNCYFRTMH